MTSAPSSSAALTVFSHSVRHADPGSAAKATLESQTEQQNNGAQTNAMTDRIDLNIRTPSFREFVSDDLAIISCLAAGQGSARNI
jgi:hypothetical protein